MAERYPDFQVQEIQELEQNSEIQNKKKSTTTWLNVWTSWTESNNFETNLLSYEGKQLDERLQKFFAEIREKDSSEYEPDSLRVKLASLDRHLREKDAAFSVAKDIEFSNSRKLLEGKARSPSQGGGTCSHDPLIFSDFIPCSSLIKPLVPKNFFSSCSLDHEIFLRCSLDPQKCLSEFSIFVCLFYLSIHSRKNCRFVNPILH